MSDDAQLGIFGSETPLDDLALSPNLKLLAERERKLCSPLTPAEAGQILHAHRGRHPEVTICPVLLAGRLRSARAAPRSAGAPVSWHVETGDSLAVMPELEERTA